jgi:hypothetical protein
LTHSAPRAAIRTPVLLFLGALLVQAAWIVALPPFRGTDEVDHAYRAAAVAGGQWRAGPPATHGRGLLVEVPRSIVDAAYPACHNYNYLSHDNCTPVRDTGSGRVVVASSAATYNPLFYAVVGTVAKPFDGAAALYAMRIAAAVLCALFLALAGWAADRWRSTSWPIVAMLGAMTPVMLFSTSVAAPNGLEMCAALAIWMSLLGLSRVERDRRAVTQLLMVATAGAVVVCLLRSIGPLWVVLVVLTSLLPLGAPGVARLLSTRRRIVAVCSGLVVAAAVASSLWSISAGTNALESVPSATSDRWTTVLGQLPLWVLQGIAAFPRRGDPAPGVVYLLVAAVLLCLLTAGMRWATARLRATMTVAFVVSVAVPVVFTLTTVTVTGAIWQGRYELPYVVGLVLLAGVSLDVVAPRGVPTVLALAVAGVAVTAAQVVSVVHVQAREARVGPFAHSPALLGVPGWLVGALVVAGFLTWTAAALPPPRPRPGPGSGP